MFNIDILNNIIVLDKTNNSETLSTEGAVLMRVILSFLFLHTLIYTIKSELILNMYVLKKNRILKSIFILYPLFFKHLYFTLFNKLFNFLSVF